MKLKNIFRLFFTVAFIIGTTTINAQTNIYFYKNDGTTHSYNIAEIDSISVISPSTANSNLLVNSGFEEPDDDSDDLPEPWVAVPIDWFTSYYSGFTTNSHNSANRVGGGTAGSTFFTSGNGSAVAFVRTGKYTGRLLLSATSGMYQLVDVTPGDYQIAVNMAINQIGQSIIKSDERIEKIKVLSPDGMVTYGTLTIPATNRTLMTLTGMVTIPEGVTQVRFQLDQRDYAVADGGRAPLMLFDECKFCRGICPGNENNIDDPDVALPIRDILNRDYIDKDDNPTLYFGCTPGTMSPAPNNADVNREFSYITPGNAFKQTQCHPNLTTWNWSNSDPWIQAARNNGQVIRIHGPISPQCSEWTKNKSRTAVELEQNMRDYTTELCRRYNQESDVIKWLDVVNETIKSDGTWFYDMKDDPSLYMNPWPKIGYDTSPEAIAVDPAGVPLYILYAFEIATREAPNIKLIINQHNGVSNAIVNKMKKLVIYLRNKGCRVDGVGWQAHVSPGWEKTAGNVTNLSAYIDWCHANNLEFHITELNLQAASEAERTNEINKQADTFLAITRTVVQKRKTGFVAINLWNMKSCGTSDSGKPICAPWACNGNPLSAAIRIKAMLLEEAVK